MIIEEEAWRQILNSYVLCLFARGVYTKELVIKSLKALGYNYNEEDLMRIGREIYVEKHKIKREEGFQADKIRIPRRVLETPTPLGRISENYIKKALEYYDKRVDTIMSSQQSK
jgi:aldehyde:ferredoxin oxidoreductase